MLKSANMSIFICWYQINSWTMEVILMAPLLLPALIIYHFYFSLPSVAVPYVMVSVVELRTSTAGESRQFSDNLCY